MMIPVVTTSHNSSQPASRGVTQAFDMFYWGQMMILKLVQNAILFVELHFLFVVTK